MHISHRAARAQPTDLLVGNYIFCLVGTCAVSLIPLWGRFAESSLCCRMSMRLGFSDAEQTGVEVECLEDLQALSEGWESLLALSDRTVSTEANYSPRT